MHRPMIVLASFENQSAVAGLVGLLNYVGIATTVIREAEQSRYAVMVHPDHKAEAMSLLSNLYPVTSSSTPESS